MCSASIIAVASPANAAPTQSPDASPEQVRSQYTTEQIFSGVMSNTSVTVIVREPSTLTSALVPSGVRARTLSCIECKVVAENPHFSGGTGGMIFKSRVTCTGKGSHAKTATVRVRGGLFLSAATNEKDTRRPSFIAARSSDETRGVKVNGASSTFYTSAVRGDGAKGTGFWSGTSSLAIIVPSGWATSSSTSQVVFKDCK